MSRYTLGVDTSNYATSLAVFDTAGEVVCAKKRFLPVKAGQLGLRPVMTLKTTVSTIKVYEPGTSVSYGRRFVTDRTTRMGVVPYGYADGFFRCLSDRWQMMTAEGPAPQRGRICMDMCMIDLTDRPSVDVGDEVEIFGPDNSVNDMAEQAGTIPYELTCAVSKRVPRIYLRQGQEIARELLLRF